MRHYVRSSLKSSIIEEMPPSPRYYTDRYDGKLYGTAKIGETITMKYDGETYQGKIVYIHPKNRFFTIQTAKGMRESFYFPLPRAKEA